MKKKFLLGLAAILLPWTAWAQNQFVVTAAESVIYNGNETQNDIARTIQVKIKVGETEIDTSSEYYDISYSKGSDSNVNVKDVGNYTITVTGKAGTLGAGYETGTTNFAVTPKPLTKVNLNEENLKKTYGTADKDVDLHSFVASIEGLVDESDFDAALNCLKLARVQGDNGENVGQHMVTVVGKTEEDKADDGVYNYSYTQSGTTTNVTMEIVKKPLTITLTGRSYNGNSTQTTSLEGSNYTFKTGELVGEDDVTLKLTAEEGKESMTDAATYSLTASLEGNDAGNYEIANEDNIVAYTIGRATLTVTEVSDKTWSNTFGDTEPDWNDYFTIGTWYGDDEETYAESLSLKLDGNTAGTHKIKLYYNDDEIDGSNQDVIPNYTISYTAKDFTINQKTLQSTDVNIDIKDMAYQGGVFDPIKGYLTVTVGEGETAPSLEYGEDKDYTYTLDNTTATNAGDEFTVTLTFNENGNYTSTEESPVQKRFTIGRATLNFTLKDENTTFGKVYGAEEPENLIAEYDIDGWQGDEQETLEPNLIMMRHGSGSANPEDQKVGEYQVYLYYGTVDKDGYIDNAENPTGLSNYRIGGYDVNNTKFYITKKPATYHIAAANETYGDKEHNFTVEIDGLIEADKDEKAEIFEVAPIVELAKDEEGNAIEAKNVGTYDLTLTNEDEVVAYNYELTYDGTKEDHKDGQLTIGPAPLTITVEAQTISFEEKADLEDLLIDWAKYQNEGPQKVTFTGNKYSDGSNLRKLFTLGLSEAVQNGEGVIDEDGNDFYENGIVVNLKDEEDLATEALKTTRKNYEIGSTNLVAGNLTIKAAAGEDGEPLVLVLDGAEDAASLEEGEKSIPEKLDDLNGAVVKTVTIENLVNYVGSEGEDGKYKYTQADHVFVPGHWYTMVLPFDVKLSELSEQLGYAIFYTPNAQKTKVAADGWSDIYFSITFDKIPANTMMLFRVDGSKEIATGLTFKNRKIAALTEEEAENGIEINGGINYVPVYAKKTLTGDDYYTEWFMRTYDGKFLGVTALKENNYEGLDVYPFNAYITTPEPPAASSVRFYIENSDGSTTAINAVTGEAVSSVAEGWYTVGGVKLNGEPTQKGVYINNGKKVVIK